jgi:opacity protein-like surface antigen
MRKYLLAAAAVVAVATPAAARDGSGYFGIEGGILFPKDQNANLDATFVNSAQTPAAGTVVDPLSGGTGLVGAIAPAPGAISGDANLDMKRGYDIDAIAGYDFGMFRLEGEIGYKRSKIDNAEVDGAFITALEAGLNPGTVGTPFVFDDTDFDLSDRVSVLSGMVNALLDFGNEDGLSFYAGGGFGRARVKMLGDSDSAWAWQGIAGVRFAISPNIDLGLKYRYFRTGNLDLFPGSAALASSTRTETVANVNDPGVDPADPADDIPGTGTTDVTFTRTAALTGDFSNHFSSHSLLASLIFNFGSHEEVAPPPPPPPPPPPAPPPPATQTCPDGTVILATEACPAPPPPPPPPPPAPERG